MNQFQLYQDIQARTGGEVYMAVVGPVRTGKSTFIRRLMEMLVFPNISAQDAAEITDQLPVSGSGKTITTVEPKFIPKNAITIYPEGEESGYSLKVRFIDCVGYMVEGASGHMEDGEERMVRTPWSEEELPFSKAGDIGTGKVIFEHSTLGIVMTTDGSFGEIPRENYVEAEERTIRELQSTGKPFLLILNTNRPLSKETKRLAEELEKKYAVMVLPMNCEQMRQEDVDALFSGILQVFPIGELAFYLPKWMGILSEQEELLHQLYQEIGTFTEPMHLMRHVRPGFYPCQHEKIKGFRVGECNLQTGQVSVVVEMHEACYYEMLSRITGEEIVDEYRFMKTLKELAEMKKEYCKMQAAWSNVRMSGYGVVSPRREEIVLEEPELIRQGSRFGIKIRAVAPSVQMIRAEITTEVAPIVGSEEQAQELIQNMISLQNENADAIWDTNIFGKTMGQMVEDGIANKIAHLTEDSQRKLQESMQKIVNESNGGLVCFII